MDLTDEQHAKLVEAFRPAIQSIHKGTEGQIERAMAPLLERIEELERRVEELERRLSLEERTV